MRYGEDSYELSQLRQRYTKNEIIEQWDLFWNKETKSWFHSYYDRNGRRDAYDTGIGDPLDPHRAAAQVDADGVSSGADFLRSSGQVGAMLENKDLDNYEYPFPSDADAIGQMDVPVREELIIRNQIRNAIREQKAINEILLLDKNYAPIDRGTYEQICQESLQFFAIIDRLDILQEGLWDRLSGKAKKFIDKMGSGFKKKLDSIKAIASQAKVGLKTVLQVLRAKGNFLFKLFSAVGWKNLGKSLLELIKKAKKVYAEFRLAIVEWIKTNPAVKTAIDSGKILAEHVDSLLEKFPIVKKIGGPVVAGILLLIWMDMSFTGDWDSDMNMTPILEALSGDYSITELFLSDAGIEMLALFALGTTVGLSFPWLKGLSTAKKVVAAFVYTFGYIFLKKKLRPDKQNDDEEEEVLRESIRMIILESQLGFQCNNHSLGWIDDKGVWIDCEGKSHGDWLYRNYYNEIVPEGGIENPHNWIKVSNASQIFLASETWDNITRAQIDGLIEMWGACSKYSKWIQKETETFEVLFGIIESNKLPDNYNQAPFKMTIPEFLGMYGGRNSIDNFYGMLLGEL